MNRKRTRRMDARSATPAPARLQQQSLMFEEDTQLWKQLPEDKRRDVVCLLQQMLIQWSDYDREGEQS